jgi:PII-like signaling protein
LPVIIELVGSAEKIQRLLPFLDEPVAEGLITIKAVRALRYRANRDKVRAAT